MGKTFSALGLAWLSMAAAAPYPQPLHALRQIEPGLWDIRSMDVRDGGRTMCVTDPSVLLQLGHPGQTCGRFTVANEPSETTVHYSCASAGHGQTTIRVETPRLIQIDTQGIVRQTPFQMRFEGRRTGPCGAIKP